MSRFKINEASCDQLVVFISNLKYQFLILIINISFCDIVFKSSRSEWLIETA